jgi:hypothetical protein
VAALESWISSDSTLLVGRLWYLFLLLPDPEGCRVATKKFLLLYVILSGTTLIGFAAGAISML